MTEPALQEFAEDLWIADGPAANVAGFSYPGRMAVIRLARDELFIWSPVQLSPQLKADVEALGYPAFLIAPNTLHYLWLKDWQEAFPEVKLWGAPGLAAKRQDLNFDGELGTGEAPWGPEIDQVIITGNLITTEVVFFHVKSHTAIFTDLLQNFPEDWVTGWRKWIARRDRLIGPAPQVPQKFRTAFIRRKKARAAINAIKAWPTVNVLMAHGQPVTHDGRQFIATTFKWLT